MPEDSRFLMGRFRVEAAETEEDIKRAKEIAAQEARLVARWTAAFNDPGWRPVEIRRPVLIRPDGPVSSREQLHELVGGPDLPELLTVTMYEPGLLHIPGEPKEGTIPEEVQICEVTLAQLHELKRIAETTDYGDCVFYGGKGLFVIKVVSLKEKGNEASEADKGLENADAGATCQTESQPEMLSPGAEVPLANCKSPAEGDVDE
ncbi:Uncharacterized protein TPAR_01666 [Tolypocladium paradoxum]|uniref:Uncharacterized protein n=1 Tax=Tolypocladium paradoxum TaxID=94208 RepID=A0A2S4L6T5_9HYPO|nr:Uncharacterized protein TPAR_01666 [Tolypocladium paradoxum]